MEPLADKSLDFEKLCLPVNGAHYWLGFSKSLNFWGIQRLLTKSSNFSHRTRIVLEQCGRNLVVQSRHFGISKPAHYFSSKFLGEDYLYSDTCQDCYFPSQMLKPFPPKSQHFPRKLLLFGFVTGDNTQTDYWIGLIQQTLLCCIVGVDLLILPCIDIQGNKILNLAISRISNAN